VKALVYTAPGTVEVLDVPEPEPEGDEIVVQVALAGICGSELHGIRTPGFRTPPLVMGHEFAGTLPDGRRIAVNPLVSCGSCDLCLLGRPNLCRSRSLLGVHRPGGFAERVAVPAGAIHELPEGMAWEVAAMVEPLANAVHALGLAGVQDGSRVGIIGAGTIGLVCVLEACAGGVESVAVADPSASRLRVARRLGASSAGDELEGEFDVIIDAVGLPVTRSASVKHLRPGGTAVWLGLMDGDPGFDATDLVRMEKRVLGSFAYSDDEFARAIGDATRFDLAWVEAFPLTQGAAIFGQLMDGRTDVVKALLRPQ
jgi:threonine dehydrogenase-like Zn-dependent dehydrogenase